jgi:3'-phosphoadenosine 5'-phosphosulfate sulfotransferase (PAPS reductase)/FAD synthetase
MIKIPATIQNFIDDGALFVLNDSGGKDSQAMRIALRDVVPAEQKLVIHASLGEVEWPGALEHADAGAKSESLPFVVARAIKTFFEMVEHRFAVRPGPNSPCWPSASNRQCTSDLKRGPIEREVRRYMRENGFTSVVTCMGIRAEESSGRAKRNPLRRSDRNSIAGREGWEWLPIHSLTRSEVFSLIDSAGELPHPAYAAGNERLSCMFCIMGSRNDLRNAAKHNPALFDKYVEIEKRTGYTMHQSRVPLETLVAEVAHA